MEGVKIFLSEVVDGLNANIQGLQLQMHWLKLCDNSQAVFKLNKMRHQFGDQHQAIFMKDVKDADGRQLVPSQFRKYALEQLN